MLFSGVRFLTEFSDDKWLQNIRMRSITFNFISKERNVRKEDIEFRKNKGLKK